MSIASTTGRVSWVGLNADGSVSSTVVQNLRSWFTLWNVEASEVLSPPNSDRPRSIGYANSGTSNYSDFWLRVSTPEPGLFTVGDKINVQSMEFTTDSCDYSKDPPDRTPNWNVMEVDIINVTEDTGATEIRWVHGEDTSGGDALLCGGVYSTGGEVTLFRLEKDQSVPHPAKQGIPAPVTQGTPRPVTQGTPGPVT